jgi:hypothetical protein
MKKRLGVRILKHQDLKTWAGQERDQRHLALATDLTYQTSILKGEGPVPGDSTWIVTVNPMG